MKNNPHIIYRYDFAPTSEIKCRYCFVWNGFEHCIDYPQGHAWLYFQPEKNLDKQELQGIGWKKASNIEDLHKIRRALKNIKQYSVIAGIH